MSSVAADDCPIIALTRRRMGHEAAQCRNTATLVTLFDDDSYGQYDKSKIQDRDYGHLPFKY